MSSKDAGKKRQLNVRTDAERAAIVSESFAPGATVAGVARRHGVQPSLLSSWRSKSQRQKTLNGAAPKRSFAAVEIASDELVRDSAVGIEIISGLVVIRLPADRIVEIARGLARS